MDDGAPQVALRLVAIGFLLVLLVGLLAHLPLQLELLQLRTMHLIYFVKALVDLLYSNHALVLLVNDAEDRLVLLLVNGELLLHFEGAIREQTRLRCRLFG